MIDPKLLTEENGFVEGCVVEIVDTNGRSFVGHLSHITEWNVWFVESKFHGFTFNEIDSIHPLTGPLAIWNFAPIGAVALVSDVSCVKWIYADDYKHENLVKRPFWAADKKPQ